MSKMNVYFKNKSKCADLITKLRNTMISIQSSDRIMTPQSWDLNMRFNCGYFCDFFEALSQQIIGCGWESTIKYQAGEALKTVELRSGLKEPKS